MALCMSLLGCLFLAYALNYAHAQPLEESVFRQLSAQDLQNISLMQSIELLDYAARTGENVTVEITAPVQGAIIQENVNITLDCLPWLRNFPGGVVSWSRFDFTNIDHEDVVMTPNDVDDAYLNDLGGTITGEYNEILNIARSRIQTVNQMDLLTRGIYVCNVCVGIGPFQICHPANTTVAVAGRPPILDTGTGRGGYSMCVCALLKCKQPFRISDFIITTPS